MTVPKAQNRTNTASSSRGALLLGGAVALLFALGFAGIIIGANVRDSWERDNYARLRSLAQEAVDLQARDEIVGALSAYQEMLREVGLRAIRDTYLRLDVERAKAMIPQLTMRLDEAAKREAARADELRKVQEEAARRQEAAQAAPRPGSISGSMWVVLGSGASRILRGQEIALLVGLPGVAWEERLAQLRREAIIRLGNRGVLRCHPFIWAEIKASSDHDVIYFDGIMRANGFAVYRECAPSLEKVAAQHVVSLTKTDAAGRYRFRDLEPGSYTLYSFYYTDSSTAIWLMPVRVEPGQTLKLDLDNSLMLDSRNRED